MKIKVFLKFKICYTYLIFSDLLATPPEIMLFFDVLVIFSRL